MKKSYLFLNKCLASALIFSSVAVGYPGTLFAAEEIIEDAAELTGDSQELNIEILEENPPGAEAEIISEEVQDAEQEPELQIETPEDLALEEEVLADPELLESVAEGQLENADSEILPELPESEGDVENENYVEVFNDSYLQADTGHNNANYNTGSGIIMTSRAEGNGQLLNSLNTNSSNGGGSNDVFVDDDGVININNELTVKNINEAYVINRLEAEINSGSNTADYNTGHGMVATGAANLGVNFFTIANTNLFGSNKFYANVQNIYSSYEGSVDLSQEINSSSPLSSILLEAASHSAVVADVNNETSITNQNAGDINNEINATVVSGRNNANNNTGTGSISSGDVNSSVNVINFLNSNITSGNALVKTLNVFGNWKGDLKLPQMQDSQLSVSEISGSTEIENENEAVITNNVVFSGEAGSNDASYNGGAGLVQVGSSRGETNQVNVANLNVTGSSWWLVVVNKFGNWSGSAVGAPEAMAVNSAGVSTILTPQQSGIFTQNSEANVNNSTEITNTNQANIMNNLNIQAVSGQNLAQMNTGHGYIQTGNIKGTNNIINFANSNITVGDWVVVVVNVFGDWDGDLIFNDGGDDTNIGRETCPVFDIDVSLESGNSSNSTSSGSNSADINNTTGVSSISGQNDTSYNTGTGTINTGGAQAGSSVGNQANSNGSGSGSSETDNNASIDNNISGQNNTGQNSSSYNTGPGSVDTGWAAAFLDLMNNVNENEMTIGDLMGAMQFTNSVAVGQQAEIPSVNQESGSCEGVTIEVTPATSSLAYGQTLTFSALAKGPLGEILEEQPEFTWSSTGGTIDAAGNFTAGNQAGAFAVTATASYGNQGSASFEISNPGGSSGGGIVSSGSGGGGGFVFRIRKIGDFNGDGEIDDLDFSILMANWAKQRFGNLMEDAGDGIVGDRDFSIVMARWTPKKIVFK